MNDKDLDMVRTLPAYMLLMDFIMVLIAHIIGYECYSANFTP